MLRSFLIFLIFTSYSPIICQENDDIGVSLDLKYEQFDSEILIYASLQNQNFVDSSYILELALNSRDFSNHLINDTSKYHINLGKGKSTNLNVKTLEFSVLAKSDVFAKVYSKDKLLGVDSINFNFPNAFTLNKDGSIKDVEIDLGGLKIDRTRTPVGRNFFEKFEKEWNSPSWAKDYTIEFEELPFRFRTTILKIYLDNDKIFETYLRDNNEFIDQLVNYLSSLVKQKLKEQLNRDDEIGGDWNGI